MEGVEATPEQIIMSHTPFQSMAEEHKNQRVLVLGHEGCLEVSETH
jgi:ribonucleotide monophosphatase NagD (HAD superfamily)